MPKWQVDRLEIIALTVTYNFLVYEYSYSLWAVSEVTF